MVGGVVLLGWQLESEILKVALPGQSAMNPTSALAFMLAAGALWLRQRAARESSSGGAMNLGARVLAAVVIAAGVATVSTRFCFERGSTRIACRRTVQRIDRQKLP